MNTKTNAKKNQVKNEGNAGKNVAPKVGRTKGNTADACRSGIPSSAQIPSDAAKGSVMDAGCTTDHSVKTEKKRSYADRKREETQRKKERKAEEEKKNAEEILKKISELPKTMKGYTWKDLEVGKKFNRNEKLKFIVRPDVLITGCDVGSEMNYIRSINNIGEELSKKPKAFGNNREGFQKMLEEMLRLAAKHDKKKIVLVIEPTGHYWMNLYRWMEEHHVTVLQVNPYAVKATKEIETNEQSKNDRKDPKVIAELAKNGNYSVPYLPDAVYARLRDLSLFRDQIQENRVREINRLQRLIYIHFPELTTVYKDITKKSCLLILKKAPLPRDIRALGEDGIKQIWKDEKLRGGTYQNAVKLLEAAAESIAHTEDAAAETVRREIGWLVDDIMMYDKRIEVLDEDYQNAVKEVPHVDKILDIKGLSFTTVTGIVAQIGDISRFDDPKELQKLAGLAIVGNESGKHKGQSKISKRGRKRLRYWLTTAVRPLLLHNDAFSQYHQHYMTREKNPLKKLQADIVCAGKLLRIIYAILKTGVSFDESKMLSDIVYPA